MHDGLTRLRASLPALALAAAAGLAAIAGSYAVTGFAPAFVVAPVEGALARLMPAVVVRYAIVLLGGLGQQLNLLAATALVALGVAGLTLAALAVAGRAGRPVLGPLLAALGTLVAALAATGSAASALGAALPVGVVLSAATLRPEDDGATPDLGRRSALGAFAGAAGFGALAYLFGRRDAPSGASQPATPTSSGDREADAGADGGETENGGETEDGPSAEELLATAADRSLGVEGLGPLVSESFYNVDINAVDPQIAAGDWELRVTGAVEREVTVSYDDLRAFDTRQQFNTLRCVGESLNGRKMDNALWEVVPIEDVLAEAGVELTECCVMLRASDDYYEEFPAEALRGAALAVGMNGGDLPRSHGHPVRALVPGHWGEINVKWLTEIEVLPDPAEGYWEERGWHGTGPVETVAKLHAVDRSDGQLTVGGHAYAGTRGISRVEVSTDGGETWADARLSEALPGDDVWRQWAYEYDAPGRSHEVVVRAYEADGTRQPREQRDPFPNGPAGWVSRTIEP
jgi:hypothetical protein